jgi:hypothetical protein
MEPLNVHHSQSGSGVAADAILDTFDRAST